LDRFIGIFKFWFFLGTFFRELRWRSKLIIGGRVGNPLAQGWLLRLIGKALPKAPGIIPIIP